MLLVKTYYIITLFLNYTIFLRSISKPNRQKHKGMRLLPTSDTVRNRIIEQIWFKIRRLFKVSKLICTNDIKY